jgi:DNA-binding NarL/FixJ family response regulator
MMAYSENTFAGRKRRILIVDDHPIIQQGLAELLAREPDMEVCGSADNVADALQEVEASRPDLVLVDMTLKDSHGIDLIVEINRRGDDIKTVVWSMFDEKIFAERAIRAGAMGYINKKEPIERLVEAIRGALDGNFCLSTKLTNRLLQRASGNIRLDEDPVSRLSNREVEIFAMIGEGMTTRLIAHKLGLSPKTVEAHRENVKAKLELKNSGELSRRAVLWVLENS